MNRFIVFKILALLLILGIWAVPFSSHAQDQVSFSALEVDIWPEYDRPGVLIIYRITLSPDITLPVDLALVIPSGAGDPNAVAVKETGGGLFNLTFNREVNGAWSKISFTATMPDIQVEYYDPNLLKENKHRHFEFSWQGDYAVEALSIQVQQPVGASDMVIKPSLGDGVVGQDGLVYYNSQVGSLTSEQTFTLTLDYEKDSDALSAENLEIKPSAPFTKLSVTQHNFMTVLPWILGALGIILICGGTLWYWQSGKGKFGIKTPAAKKKPRRMVSTAPVNQEEGYIYCQNCGKRALPNDRFCRVCGTKLRVE
jgi:hypothetical protein